MKKLKGVDEEQVMMNLKNLGFIEGAEFYHTTTEIKLKINPKCISIYSTEEGGICASIGCYMIWSYKKGIMGEFI